MSFNYHGLVHVPQGKENESHSTGSAYSWRGKKFTILKVPTDNHSSSSSSSSSSAQPYVNPFRNKKVTNNAAAAAAVDNTNTASTSPTKQHPTGKDLDLERSSLLNELGINQQQGGGDMSSAPSSAPSSSSVDETNGFAPHEKLKHEKHEEGDMPPLLPSEEPTLPSSRSGSTATGNTTATTSTSPTKKKKKKKKKMAVSFSNELEETRTFKRVEEGDVKKLWYSQDEAKEERANARHETRDMALIGMSNSCTQTSPMVAQIPISRREQVAQMRGKITTGRVNWRKGQKINKIELHNQVSMPNDPVYAEVVKKGYVNDGTGRFRKVHSSR